MSEVKPSFRRWDRAPWWWKKNLITHNVNGSHCNRGNPGCPCCCGAKVCMYLHIEHTKGLDDPECQAKDQEAGEQDEPGVASVRGRSRRHGWPALLSARWRVHDDVCWFSKHSFVWEKHKKMFFVYLFMVPSTNHCIYYLLSIVYSLYWWTAPLSKSQKKMLCWTIRE